MPAPGKIKELAKRGDPARLIPAAVNRYGNQAAAAKELGLSTTTISLWLKEHGYVVRRIWVRPKDKKATDEFIAVMIGEDAS